MLNALRFVQGAVAKKDFVPELTHFHIQGGTIRGYNGMIGLCCPIDLDLDVCPKAVQLVKAIQTCKDTIQLHVTTNGRLAVKSGKFKAFIDCIPSDFPEVIPEGVLVPIAEDFIGAVKKLAPFIAEDASRPWARGILFRGQSAFATNNIVLAEYWLGFSFPVEINVPRMAVVELLRIGENPIALQVTDNCVTFHFEGDKWLRTQTFTNEWPDVSVILERETTPVAIPNELWEAVEDLKPFVDDVGRVYMTNERLATSLEEASGAISEVPALIADGCFNFEQLLLLKPVAQVADFRGYPKPCLFYGDRIRGAIIGMRINGTQ